MGRQLAGLLAALALSGCANMNAAWQKKPEGANPPKDEAPSGPRSPGEIESGYTYIPIDPFPVRTVDSSNCPGRGDKPATSLLDALPDNAVRMLVEKFDASGNVAYGASKAASMYERYRVTVDYINADTINVPVVIKKTMQVADPRAAASASSEWREVDLFAENLSHFLPGSERYEVRRLKEGEAPGSSQFNIPVYVGVGLRVSAYVYVTGASANISGIGIIGAEAEANNLRGSLVVQTLGVNGKSVAAALPIQSELNRTTAQSAIVAVGAIKALLYADETIKSPRVVGLYLPFPGGKPLVNAIISELSKKQVEWSRPCSLLTK
jgi:hypothetical protein